MGLQMPSELGTVRSLATTLILQWLDTIPSDRGFLTVLRGLGYNRKSLKEYRCGG